MLQKVKMMNMEEKLTKQRKAEIYTVWVKTENCIPNHG